MIYEHTLDRLHTFQQISRVLAWIGAAIVAVACLLPLLRTRDPEGDFRSLAAPDLVGAALCAFGGFAHLIVFLAFAESIALLVNVARDACTAAVASDEMLRRGAADRNLLASAAQHAAELAQALQKP